MTAPTPRTIVEKIWTDHVVTQDPGAPAVLAVDLHLVHEVTSPQAFSGLRARGIGVRRPGQTVATPDHSIPTTDRSLPFIDAMALAQVNQLEANCTEFGIPLHGIGDPGQGIVHVIGPQLGLTQPGMTIVCGDSHTSTHGAFGALAFGIGTSEVEMVLATQTLLQRDPKTYEVRVDGRLTPGVSAKDIILALIARIGIGGGTGHVFEYTGEAIRGLTMEQRMTVCNMSIEGGARAGLIAPDDTTFDYLHGRAHAPSGPAWDAAVAGWRTLPTDEGATYDKTITIDANALEPMVTYGTNPGMGIPITSAVPSPDEQTDPGQRRALERALEYMDLQPGQAILGQKVDVVFVGSCTNGRISDLRLAAGVLKDRRVAEGVRLMVVPGSDEVKREAEAEGLSDIFKAAGAEWREAGCSMCIAMNGDQLQPGQYAVSTSNRNFEGRQGKGGRTFLASPLTAAASAIAGVVADPRRLPGIESLAAVGGR
ncbi:MAG: 3-isopropylmalate dehydratase large subunit [Chloroflexota bacterium]